MNAAFQPQEPFDERGHSPAHQLYEEARRLMDAGSFEQAAELFHRSAAEEPHFKTYKLLGECYTKLRLLTHAIPYLAAATTLNRGVRAPSLLAEAWLALGRQDRAVEAAEIVLSRDPKHKAALLMREQLKLVSEV